VAYQELDKRQRWRMPSCVPQRDSKSKASHFTNVHKSLEEFRPPACNNLRLFDVLHPF
jgi:hypothetical protein